MSTNFWLEETRHAENIRKEMNKARDGYYAFLVKRDGEKCQLCGDTQNLQIDHVLPVVNGGDNSTDNLRLLCATCNKRRPKNQATNRKCYICGEQASARFNFKWLCPRHIDMCENMPKKRFDESKSKILDRVVKQERAID